jgi:hypothetical protein
MPEYPILTIVAILFLHFVADFIAQTRWQAENKSHNWEALTKHVAVYTAFFMLPCMILAAMNNPNPDNRPMWAVLNGILHFVTDAITSRRTAANWNGGKPGKAFWVWIGFDQFIHASTLIATWMLLVGECNA